MLRPLRIRIAASGEAADALRDSLRSFPGFTEVSGEEVADLVVSPGSDPGFDGSVGGDDPPYFTPRELEILEYMAEGWSNGEIGEVLGITERTVRFHAGGIYSKFGVSRRIDAVREALRRGLVSF
jgi:DNA-binding NarL/FixJ family response regulator